MERSGERSRNEEELARLRGKVAELERRLGAYSASGAAPLRGSGYLMAERAVDDPVMAVTWVTGKWPNRAAPDTTLITYEFAGADRFVYMDQPDYESQVDSWMGHNIGHWEGDTLVITVTGQMPDTWLDSSGNWHSYQMRVEERYTLESANVIRYEATITDPEVYTEPWTISMPLYRRLDANMQLIEFKCVEYVEELLYGQYRKPGVE